MLGKPVTKPLKIADLLSREGLHLALTFESPSREVMPWLLEQSKTRTHIDPEEFKAIVRANQVAGANWCKNNTVGLNKQLYYHPYEREKPSIIKLIHDNN